jgi:ligand-binding sensor domain-containing protein
VIGRAPAVVALLLAVAPAAAAAPRGALYTNTSDVEALAVAGGTLWVGTSGGLEEWEVATLIRRRLYTTDDGLADNRVQQITVEETLRVQTATAACTLVERRWRCHPQPAPAPRPTPPRMFAGRRMTGEVRAQGRTFVGTAGAGLWLAGPPARRLTPEDQICSNNVVALAAFRDRTWYGSFDEGLCSFDGRRFTRAALPAAMINDLLASSGVLYVATARGLYFTEDGARFRAVPALGDRAVVDLASDGRTLFAVTPVSLWRLPLHPGCGVARSDWQPGGSHALQAVDVAGGTVWVATEDRGLVRQRRGRPFEVFDRAAGLPSSWSVDVAATADGGAFAATLRDGLVRVEGDGRVHRVPGPFDPWLLHLTARGPTLWVGTQGGAAVLGASGVVAIRDLPHPAVHALLPGAGGLWVATEGGTTLRWPIAAGAKVEGGP